MNDGLVNSLPETVGRATPPEAAAQKAPEALFDSNVSRAVITRVEMKSEFVGLDLADSAIEEEVDEML
ncbi:MAG: hypothetical protein WC538_05660 [Thermoanaerobaculia bacterium]|jgi:hypothetical protein